MTSPTDTPSDPQAPDGPSNAPREQRFLTIPNILCVLRLAGAPVLVVLAMLDRPFWFLGLYLVLAFTDWLDGKLAMLLKQRSVIGPRLDSAADVAMYAGLLIGGVRLTWDVIHLEIVWIALALVSYVFSTVYGLWKFGGIPTYHTRAAKTSWLLILIAALLLFAKDLVYPLRVAMVFVVLTNIEALMITWVLPERKSDVASVFHALRFRGE